jgi:hypothetical protein
LPALLDVGQLVFNSNERSLNKTKQTAFYFTGKIGTKAGKVRAPGFDIYLAAWAALMWTKFILMFQNTKLFGPTI